MKKIVIFICICKAFTAIAQNDLNHYIVVAKQNSPLINDNENQSKASLYDAERTKAQYTNPQIGIAANYLFAPIISKDNNKTTFVPNAENADRYYGYDLANSNGGTYQAMLNATQPLFNGERYKIAIEPLVVTSKIYQNNNKLNAHDIEKLVTDQYILCLQDMKQTQYAAAMAKLLDDQKYILTKLVENSLYKESDLMLLNIEHQNFLAQSIAFKANYRRDLMDLNILAGINDTALIQIENVEIIFNKSISNSLFLEKYNLDSLNLMAQQKTFELKYKPQFNLFANTGLNATYAPTIANRLGMSAGLSFTYNFFDGNQKEMNRNRTRVITQSVSFYKNNFVVQNTIRKSKITTELDSYAARISLAEGQLKEYDALLNSYKKEIVSGQLSIINYVTVLKNMAMAQRDYTLLFSQKQSLINTYNYWNW